MAALYNMSIQSRTIEKKEGNYHFSERNQLLNISREASRTVSLLPEAASVEELTRTLFSWSYVSELLFTGLPSWS